MNKQQYRHLTRRLRRPFSRMRAFWQLRDFHRKQRSIEEIVQRALDFGSGGAYRVKTQQMPEEILALTRAVAELRPAVILEIGTARGGTLLIWSQLASQEVITCDLQDLSEKEDLLKAFPPPGSACRVTLMSGDSHDPDFKRRVEHQLNGRKVDFLFIDGDHRLAGVTQDYSEYRGLVRPGGIIAFHDIVEAQPFPTNEVYGLWKQLREDMSAKEFIQDRAQVGFGIGIIRVPN